MYSDVFIRDFAELGKRVSDMLNNSSDSYVLRESMEMSESENNFFTFMMQREALLAISQYMLNENALKGWLSRYSLSVTLKSSYIGVIAAGNIPAVCFHDILSVLASGYKCEVKLSRRDSHLIPGIFSILADINTFWCDRVVFKERISSSACALIAAGSDYTMKLIGSEFKNIPTLLRGTKSSVAVLSGDEDDKETDSLCDDIFLYFGMGCRSISRILVPENYKFERLIDSSKRYTSLSENRDFNASYRYQKALMTMTGERFIDAGFFILSEECDFPPPLAVVGYQYYKNENQIVEYLRSIEERIQIIEWSGREGCVDPGMSQKPSPDEYADGIDTLSFILRNAKNN